LSRWAPRSPGDVPALIAAHPLAWVVARDFRAGVLPLVPETDAEGRLVSLLGHCARRNPLVESLQRDPAALILVQGPHGYVSPGLVSRPQWGPTWNYAVARIEATVEFLPGDVDHALRTLATHLEGEGGWTVERMGPRYEPMQAAIVAFRASVTAVEASFKLGQDEDDRTFAEIVAGHADPALTTLMRAQREPAT
jgi:transcriptional regulator